MDAKNEGPSRCRACDDPLVYPYVCRRLERALRATPTSSWSTVYVAAIIIVAHVRRSLQRRLDLSMVTTAVYVDLIVVHCYHQQHSSCLDTFDYISKSIANTTISLRTPGNIPVGVKYWSTNSSTGRSVARYTAASSILQSLEVPN